MLRGQVLKQFITRFLLTTQISKRKLSFSDISEMSRGALIVIEGCDRSGKTTLCNNLVSSLITHGISAEYVNFPDRTTDIGHMIDQYLRSKVEISDEAIHLLFSANRWEKDCEMRAKLLSGVTLIVDRYAFSGVAYSSAKGLDLNWCKNADIGLPKPDRVFLLTLTTKALQGRGGFGEERYEESAFQQKVLGCYEHLKDDTWEEIDADRTITELHECVLKKIIKVRENVPHEVKHLWRF